MTNQQLQQLQLLISNRNYLEAETLCIQLQKQPGIDDALIVRALIHIYVKTGRHNLAINLMKPQFLSEPSNRELCDNLANLYGNIKDYRAASDCYYRYLEFNPNESEALYNLAFNLRHAGEFENAISYYCMALKYDINMPEEVLLNIAVIYSDHLRDDVKAKSALEDALQINSEYLPALFNLANFYEQSGDKNEACKLFEKILYLEPNHFETMARLADIYQFSDKNSSFIQQMLSALSHNELDQSVKIDLLYALGKAYNDCREYKLAFERYQQANDLNRSSQNLYDPDDFSKYVQQIISFFSKEWVSSHYSDSDYAPVFICGMFRSGSTLIEQILASHPLITAGGELEYFIRKVSNELAPFPKKLNSDSNFSIELMAQEYLEHIQSRFPEAKIVTDKRPDNLFYLGLIFCIFPKTKIIFTERHFLDNYLSIFFQRLGNSMNYATDLKHIEHYHSEVQKLMLHWQSLFGDSIHVVSYDELINDPKYKINQVLTFLGLEWSENCLNFHQLKNRVKTASVWQVRKPLYSSSSGRWRNYQREISQLFTL